MMSPAIILVGHSRPDAMQRLMRSVSKAEYNSSDQIPMVISIDGGGPDEVYQLANNLEWTHGPKSIVRHSENMGLREHILSCGDLSEEYGSVIILEDDCFVSRNFYTYSQNALDYYKNDARIAGIGLYSYAYNETAYLPFSPVIDGNDVYFMQVPCSWGQAWTYEQWKMFRTYYQSAPEFASTDMMPEAVKNWPESSWKKYFMKYMLDSNKYFVYPVNSFSTNFADPGENWGGGLTFFQTPLEHETKPSYKFINLDDSNNKYDPYFEILPECLIRFGAEIDPDTCIDIYASRQRELIKNKFLLSAKKCNKPLKRFGVNLKPLLQNVINGSNGNIFSYGLTDDFQESKSITILYDIWQKQQSQGYYFASKTRYYKLGYYFLHPLRFIKKRIKK